MGRSLITATTDVTLYIRPPRQDVYWIAPEHTRAGLRPEVPDREVINGRFAIDCPDYSDLCFTAVTILFIKISPRSLWLYSTLLRISPMRQNLVCQVACINGK